jgi:hypothetical protein
VQYFGKTNDDGIYVVPNLPPGAYRLQVSKRGFKTLIKPDIVLNIQDALSINFTLPAARGRAKRWNSQRKDAEYLMTNFTKFSVRVQLHSPSQQSMREDSSM